MGMLVFKMFEKGLICRGYQYKVGVNECDHATCVREGFHAAENPLDCLSYYSNFDGSECWLCYADGDVHEDGSDSKISCTKLGIIRRLGKEDFLSEALVFMYRHPKRPWSNHVTADRGEVYSNGFTVVRGRDPLAKGRAIGDYLALAKEDENGDIIAVGLFLIDGEVLLPDVWYDVSGETREVT